MATVQPLRTTFTIPRDEPEITEPIPRPAPPPPPPRQPAPPPPPPRQPVQPHRQPVQQQQQHRVPILQQLQPVEAPRTRAPVVAKPVTTPAPSSSTDYEYVYEYEDGSSVVAPPKPVKFIDDYDLVPLSQKVKQKY